MRATYDWPTSRAELIALLQRSDGFAEGVSMLVERYRGPAERYLVALLRRCGRETDAAEVFQQCLVDLVERSAKGDPRRAWTDAFRPDRGGFRDFLRGVLRNYVRRHLRRCGKADASLVDDPPDAASSASGPDAAFDEEWAAALVRGALARASEALAGRDDAGASRLAWRVFVRRHLRVDTDGRQRSLREIGVELDLAEAEAQAAERRARRAFEASLRAAVREYVTDGRVEAELSDLLEAIGRVPGGFLAADSDLSSFARPEADDPPND